MGSLGVLFDRKARYFAAAIALLLAMIVPALVSADQVETRSIELSSSSAAAQGVEYVVNFTAKHDAGAFVVDFCENSPMIGEACDAPAGFSASGATSATAGFTDVSALDANTLVVTGDIDISTEDEISVSLEGINNPTDAGSLYARIVTYGTDTEADKYVSNDINGTANDATPIDQGGVAMSITSTVGVSGAVMETMSFCVAKVNITKDCGNADTDGNEPVLKLGEDIGDTVALTPGTVSADSLYAQVSSNALNGVVVSLKSSNDCGGLKRAGETVCDIAPALTNNVTGSSATFGLRAAAAADPIDNDVAPSGIFQIKTGSGYNGSSYVFNYLANKSSGVTSTYGDPFLDTGNAPVNNKNMQLTFGASASNDTPAGIYATDLSLIATGKF